MIELLTDPQAWLAFVNADGARDRARHRQHHLHLDPGGPAATRAATAAARIIGLALAMLTRIAAAVLHRVGDGACVPDLFSVFGPELLRPRPHPDRRRPVPAGQEHASRSTRALEGQSGRAHAGVSAPISWRDLVQIAIIDIVFSLDSVITAVGSADELPIMVAAIVLADRRDDVAVGLRQRPSSTTIRPSRCWRWPS